MESFYAALLRELPTEEDASLVLDARTCVAPPPELETGGLFARGIPEGHGYSDSVRAEVVELFGEKQSYRALGLLIFSSIFHSTRTRTVLHLRREGGDDFGGEPITEVVVDDPRREDPGPPVSELWSRPTAYGYWPAVRTNLNPLYGAPHPSGFELPHVVWSNEEEMWPEIFGCEVVDRLLAKHMAPLHEEGRVSRNWVPRRRVKRIERARIGHERKLQA